MLLALAAGIFALDYKIKEYVNSEWLQGSRQEILHGRLILRNCHNHGFSGILKPINPAYGTEISGLVLGGVIWEFLRQTVAGGRKTARLGLALVLGGGAGNYAERRRKGYGLCEPWRWKFQNPKMGFQFFGCVYCPWRAELGRGVTSAEKEKIKEVYIGEGQ